MSFILAFGAGSAAVASIASTGPRAKIVQLLSKELEKKFPGARIEIGSNLYWTHGELSGNKVTQVILQGENAKGEAQFTAWGEGEKGMGSAAAAASFSAWVPAWVALHRVHPGERLIPENFISQEVNVATGMPRENRGVILSKETSISGLEARQTILEGQYALSTGVQRVPDIRRGEPVRVRMLSGMIQLSTLGTAQEPAYLNGQIRVLTNQSKRELIGKLCADGVVEVQL